MAAKEQTPSPGGAVIPGASNWLFQRLPRGMVETLSDSQQKALHDAIGDAGWAKPPVNIRLTLPFVNRRFYITVVSGPELRSAERQAAERTQYPLRTAANVFFFVGVGTLFYMAALIVLALQSAIVEF